MSSESQSGSDVVVSRAPVKAGKGKASAPAPAKGKAVPAKGKKAAPPSDEASASASGSASAPPVKAGKGKGSAASAKGSKAAPAAKGKASAPAKGKKAAPPPSDETSASGSGSGQDNESGSATPPPAKAAKGKGKASAPAASKGKASSKAGSSKAPAAKGKASAAKGKASGKAGSAKATRKPKDPEAPPTISNAAARRGVIDGLHSVSDTYRLDSSLVPEAKEKLREFLGTLAIHCNNVLEDTGKKTLSPSIIQSFEEYPSQDIVDEARQNILANKEEKTPVKAASSKSGKSKKSKAADSDDEASGDEPAKKSAPSVTPSRSNVIDMFRESFDTKRNQISEESKIELTHLAYYYLYSLGVSAGHGLEGGKSVTAKSF